MCGLFLSPSFLVIFALYMNLTSIGHFFTKQNTVVAQRDQTVIEFIKYVNKVHNKIH